MIEVRSLHYAYPGSPSVLHGVDLRVAPGELVLLIGPNGSGKTTLLRLVAGILRPQRGEVRFEGKPLGAMDRMQVARRIALAGARVATDLPYRVAEVVALGRLPHLGAWGLERDEDRRAIARAMRRTGVETMARRLLRACSAGEQQRVLIARALAQEPRVLLLDEPAAHLDARHQVALCALVRSLADEEGLVVVMVAHEWNVVAQVCDRVVVLAQGRVVADAPPQLALQPEVLEPVFGVRLCAARGDRLHALVPLVPRLPDQGGRA